MGLSTLSLAACADYYSQVTQVVRISDFNTLENLLITLNKQPDCSVSYLDGVKRSMAKMVAAKADRLTQQQEKFIAAEAWLKRAPTMIWQTQVVHGHIAAFRQQWQRASTRSLQF